MQRKALGEEYYRQHFEALTKENKLLKKKLEQFEAENQSLKKSVYELSVRITAQASISKSHVHLDQVLREPSAEADEYVKTDDAAVAAAAGGQRVFYNKLDLKGHTGAIYAVRFSPCGKFLASASFDRTVRLWDVSGKRELAKLDEHQLNVIDVAWSFDSAQLVSGGFDRAVRLWDAETAACVHSWGTDGLVQAVSFVDPDDLNVVVAGGASQGVVVLDRRQNAPVAILEHKSAVNTVAVSTAGKSMLATGDNKGVVRLWDPSTRKLLRELELTSKPITNVSFSRNRIDDDDCLYLSINSFDEVLRVVDLAKPLFGTDTQEVISQELRGHRNANWPVRSSFFHGSGLHNLEMSSIMDQQHDEDGERFEIGNSLLLATGSVDSHVYVFRAESAGAGQLLQRLEGHKDRVYAVDFHPMDPVLASAGADGVIKIWSLTKKASVWLHGL